MMKVLQDLHRWTSSAEGPVLIAIEGKQGQELSAGEHRHARGQLFGSLGGLLSVGLDEGVWVVPRSHAVWLPPHCGHSGRSHGPFHGWSVYIAEQSCAELPAHPCTLRTSGLLREAVLRAAAWSVDDPMRPLDTAHAHLAQVILHEVRLLPEELLGLPLPRDPRLRRVAQALVDDPASERDLDAWAAWGAVSARTLSRRFVSETGFSFTAWRQRVRMLRSLELLAAGESVSAIALDLGYSTASAFIQLFRRTFGETPALYRERL